MDEHLADFISHTQSNPKSLPDVKPVATSTNFNLPPTDLDASSPALCLLLVVTKSVFTPGLLQMLFVLSGTFPPDFHTYHSLTSLSSQLKTCLLGESICSHHFHTLHILDYFPSLPNPLSCFIFIHRAYNLFIGLLMACVYP